MTRRLGILLGIIACVSASPALAQVVGTIDPVDKWAWSENIGWVNFDAPDSNVQVTDTALTGYLWSEQYSWIDLDPTTAGVTNTTGGVLGGYAWGEQTGFIDFSNVTIDNDGYFHGYASSTITGRISMNCANTSGCASSDFKVRTTWRPSAAPSYECNNGVDDDGDGRIDYPADQGCSSATDNSELSGGGPIHTATTTTSIAPPVAIPTATTSEVVAPPTDEEVAEVLACRLYIRTFIKRGNVNDVSDVSRLQAYLKTYEGFDMLPVTGTYDQDTYDAVRTFQSRYADEVLTPWDIIEPTGYVYVTTRDALNRHYCMHKQLALALREPITRPFGSDLHLGDTHDDVVRLQHFLNVVGTVVAREGYGAYGSETTYFGQHTREALGQYQLNQGLVAGVHDAAYGVLNEKTRRRINETSFAL